MKSIEKLQKAHAFKALDYLEGYGSPDESQPGWAAYAYTLMETGVKTYPDVHEEVFRVAERQGWLPRPDEVAFAEEHYRKMGEYDE